MCYARGGARDRGASERDASARSCMELSAVDPRVGVNVGVRGEPVRLVVDVPGCPRGSGGCVGHWGEACGSSDESLRPTRVEQKIFGF